MDATVQGWLLLVDYRLSKAWVVGCSILARQGSLGFGKRLLALVGLKVLR